MAKLAEERKALRALNKRREEALAAEADAVLHKKKRQEWEENGTRLTWDEIADGVPCRACGLPVVDRLGDWTPLNRLSDTERQEYEATRAAFEERHAECRSHRWGACITWSVQGSRAMHCNLCCPKPPIPEDRLVAMSKTVARMKPTDPADLATWRLTLTCDHVIEKLQHRNHSRWSSGSVQDCPECHQVRGVVTDERL